MLMLLVQGPHMRTTALGDGSFLSFLKEIKGERNWGDDHSLGTKEDRKYGMKTLIQWGEQCVVYGGIM